MPDCDPFPYNAYSGYLDINEDKALHYILVESLNDNIHDPLLLWFNGGPGCSSLLGYFSENGPWIIDDGEDFIKENPYPWNTRANVLYIESPAGVGYSWGRTMADRTFDDMTQSEDLYAAFVAFFQKFPNYVGRDVYISGESYAGIYVPYLAYQIDLHNTLSLTDPTEHFINLKGWLAGNPMTDMRIDGNPSLIPTVYNFHLIPKQLFDDFNDNGCYFTFDFLEPAENPPICFALQEQIEEQIWRLNIYDLFRHDYSADTLLQEPNRLASTMINGKEHTYKRGYTQQEYTPWLKNSNLGKVLLGDAVSDYANREDVREALHIRDDVGTWSGCGGDIDYTALIEGSIWIYQQLRNRYKVMVYSGDTDGAVATWGTKWWIDQLAWPIT